MPCVVTANGVLCRAVIPSLLEKLADSKVIVRSAVMRVLQKLMVAASARVVLELLAPGLHHSNWRVREEVVNVLIIVSTRICYTCDSQSCPTAEWAAHAIWVGSCLRSQQSWLASTPHNERIGYHAMAARPSHHMSTSAR